MAINECEMVDLNITKLTCSERTHRIADWCHVCRIRQLQKEV